MKFRSKIIALVSAAAVLAIAVAVAAFAGGFELGTPQPDKVLSQPFTLAPATAEPAPVSAVYYTEKGNYFHSIPDCSGMQGASAHDLGDALATGKGACPVCMELNEALPYTTPAVTAEPTLTPQTTVYCTKNGTYYHAYADCSGMMNARSTFPEQAEADGKVPCPVCLSADANAWFSGSTTPEPTPEPAELRYDLEVKSTLTPMPAAVDVWLSATGSIPEAETFRQLLGMDYAEAFPGYALISSMESVPADDSNAASLYSHIEFTNGEDNISLSFTPATEDQDGMFSIFLPNDTAAQHLMENAPEPLRNIYMVLAPELIENTLAAAGKNTSQTHRLGDINLLYSYDMNVTNAELTYYMNDGSTVHSGWKSCETEPELYSLQWLI